MQHRGRFQSDLGERVVSVAARIPAPLRVPGAAHSAELCEIECLQSYTTTSSPRKGHWPLAPTVLLATMPQAEYVPLSTRDDDDNDAAHFEPQHRR